MGGGKFTQTNNLPEPTYEKLDRLLMDTEWDVKFPLVIVHVLEHIDYLSDHAHILLTTCSSRPNGEYQFKFVLDWLHRDGFYDMVKKSEKKNSKWKPNSVIKQ